MSVEGKVTFALWVLFSLYSLFVSFFLKMIMNEYQIKSFSEVSWHQVILFTPIFNGFVFWVSYRMVRER